MKKKKKKKKKRAYILHMKHVEQLNLDPGSVHGKN
jgi:hypothetical protein